ncbi:MAG TPA: hypothetical protein VHM30_17780 [Gemmatimonadaceae bacterium]|nr:hypothetical protein [Gemmatimonadaceae bacterium]
MMRHLNAAVVCALVAGAVCASDAGAQQRTAKPAADQPRTIQIRGVLPTPQMVTVRPRLLPGYDRSVISPGFHDRHFPRTLDAPLIVSKGPLGGVALPVPVAKVAKAAPPVATRRSTASSQR